MNTETLVNALRGLEPSGYNWKFALYNSRKTQDGITLEWRLCAMRGIAEQIARTRDFLLKKPVAEKPVAPYTPLLSDKERIGALRADDELIREQLTDALLSIQNGHTYPADEFVTGEPPKVIGYAFYGERSTETTAKDAKTANNAVDRVLLMRRGNPFITGAAAKLYVGEASDDGAVTPANIPILKFTSTADFALIDCACYIFSSAIGKEFALEDRNFAIAQQCLDQIARSGIVSDYDLFDNAVMTARNARKFAAFDADVLQRVVNLSINGREEFLATYGINIDRNGLMDTADKEQCELIIDLLCCRSCLDPLGRLSVANGITPRDQA